MHHLYDDKDTHIAVSSTHNPLMNNRNAAAALSAAAAVPNQPSGVDNDMDLYDEFGNGEAGLELDENGYDQHGGYYDEEGRYVSPFREGADSDMAKVEAAAAAKRYNESKQAEIAANAAANKTAYDRTFYSRESIRRSLATSEPG